MAKMESVLNLYKERGETPLERIERFRKTHPEYRTLPMSYAGRLDPMAEGVLVVLVGEENRNRESYLSLTKKYEFDVLFGFATDTYDVLGVLTDAITRASWRPINANELMEHLVQMKGKRTQKYPPFSSKPFEGKPLFVKARKGEISEFTLPTHEVEIFEASLRGMHTIPHDELLDSILSDVSRVRGDFRQQKIATVWDAHVRPLYGINFEMASISLSCSSGTYVRVIAHELGALFGVPSLAYSIVRTAVGKHTIKKALREPKK